MKVVDYKALFDCSVNGIVAAQRESGKIVDANRALLSFLNYEREEIIGFAYHRLFSPQGKRYRNRELFRSSSIGRPVPVYHRSDRAVSLINLTIYSAADLLVIVFDLHNSRALPVAEKRSYEERFIEFPGLSEQYRQARELYRHRRARILIEGETGVGKGSLARYIHTGGTFIEKSPFITIDCSAIPAELFESQLFGYEKGAFTGAAGRFSGRLEGAEGGTIFFDEIDSLNLEQQASLLRFIDEKRFSRLGSTREIKLDVRIVTAARGKLCLPVSQGRFREDLYYRLKTVDFHIPPLRSRKEDIVMLAESNLKRFNSLYNKSFQGFSTEALSLITSYRWPGNIRELENAIEKIVVLNSEELVGVKHIEQADLPLLESSISREEQIVNSIDLDEGEIDSKALNALLIRKVLNYHDNNLLRSSRFLKVSRQKLRRYL